MAVSRQLQVETLAGVSCWTVCSIGMMVSNKFAIEAFPVPCTLVAMQMVFSVVALLGVHACKPSLHIGSMNDVVRWARVVPFFVGMLLTSIMALKHAPMSLVVVFRCLSPPMAMMVEQFLPKSTPITGQMLFSFGIMLLGASMYAYSLPESALVGIGWVILNSFFAISDRLLQRLMLAPDQSPVDMSKAAITSMNNLLGIFPVLVIAMLQSEYLEVALAVNALTPLGAFFVLASCIFGVGSSYTGVWALSLISATSFLVLVNANKFAIIIFEASVMRSKSLSSIQIAGCIVTILGGIYYGKAQEAAGKQQKEPELIPVFAAKH